MNEFRITGLMTEVHTDAKSMADKLKSSELKAKALDEHGKPENEQDQAAAN